MPPDRRVFEILCRGPSKCGTFASVRRRTRCPKCGSDRVRVRETSGEG